MATNYATAQYQEIIDLHTESDKVSVIGIHTPQGSKPRAMLGGFFTQFRKYRYIGCNLVMVPAARLPADPLGVSYEAGEPGSDPRDLLNPILFHGCHGDNLNTALNSIYKGTFDYTSTSVGMDENGIADFPATGEYNWESQYYRALSDPTFQKSNVMSAFRKNGLHPMVYNVVTTHQLTNIIDPASGNVATPGGLVEEPGVGFQFNGNTVGVVSTGNSTETAVHVLPRFATNKLVSLSWLDTRQVVNSGLDGAKPIETALPKIFMGLIMLPPAYKTEMYFRLVLTHRFEFKEFNTSLSNPGAVDYNAWNMTLSRAMEEHDGRKSYSLETINSSAEITTEGVF